MNMVQQSAIQTQPVFEDGQVYCTSDLDLFKISDENREVNDGHLRRLTKAISFKNLLSDFPILVTKDMVIIDGQHRYLAANELGLPIYYRFAQDTQWGDLGFANANVKKWTLEDYLHYWIVREVAPYIRLQEFLDENPHMTLGIVVQLMSDVKPHASVGQTNVSRSKSPHMSPWRRKFLDGSWEIESYENAEAMSRMLLDFKDYYAGYGRSYFVNVMFDLYRTDWYDHARMMHQLRTYGKSVEIRNATRRADYMEMLEYAYNYNRKGSSRVVFPR